MAEEQEREPESPRKGGFKQWFRQHKAEAISAIVGLIISAVVLYLAIQSKAASNTNSSSPGATTIPVPGPSTGSGGGSGSGSAGGGSVSGYGAQNAAMLNTIDGQLSQIESQLVSVASGQTSSTPSSTPSSASSSTSSSTPSSTPNSLPNVNPGTPLQTLTSKISSAANALNANFQAWRASQPAGANTSSQQYAQDLTAAAAAVNPTQQNEAAALNANYQNWLTSHPGGTSAQFSKDLTAAAQQAASGATPHPVIRSTGRKLSHSVA